MPIRVNHLSALGVKFCIFALGLAGLTACRETVESSSSQSQTTPDPAAVSSSRATSSQEQQSFKGNGAEGTDGADETDVPIPGTIVHQNLGIVDEDGGATLRNIHVNERAKDFSCSYTLNYFQVENLEDPIAQDIVNAHLKTLAFDTESPYLQPFDVEACAQKIGLEKETDQGFDSSYRYELHPKLYFNQDSILSAVYQYSEFPSDASRHTTIRTINFDLRSGELFEYEDLFLLETDYANQISQLVVKRFQDTLLPEEVERYQSGAIADHQFYISEKGLHITHLFQENIWNLTRVLLQPEDVAHLLQPSRFSDVLLTQGFPPNTSERPTCVITDEKRIENDIAGTGYLEFTITNPVDNPPQESVLVEVLMLADEGAVGFNTWFRDRQGIVLELEPPLAAGETRRVEWGRKYLQPWDSTEVKSCQWFAFEDYWERYPELMDYPMP